MSRMQHLHILTHILTHHNREDDSIKTQLMSSISNNFERDHYIT
jgi:hypothetical protein